MSTSKPNLNLNESLDSRIRAIPVLNKANTAETLSSEALFSVRERPVLTAKNLRENYSFKKLKSNNALTSSYRHCIKRYRPSGPCLLSYVLRRIPILGWITSYSIKHNLLKDVIAGLTIGIVQIPQAMAYSMMAGLPPVYGLYSTIFPVLVYAFLGTSRHLSLGTFPIISMMTNSAIEKLEAKLNQSNLNITSQLLPDDPVEARVQISMALTLMVGLFQLLFAVLHVGFVSKYLSDTIVTGFTTGAAFHIVASQSIQVDKAQIPFKLFGSLHEIVSKVGTLNWPTLTTGLVALAIFIIVKECINERYKDKMPMPVPIELILVVLGTLIAYVFAFDTKYNIKVVGPIAKGLPIPQLPAVGLLSELYVHSISISVVSFALNISMAKLFAKKYQYELRTNQEAFAYGVGNIVASFFKSFPGSVALSRSAILDSVGGKSQIFGLISTGLLLFVCLLVGPLLRTLPNAVLAAMIIYSLKNMLMQLKQFPSLLRRSKFEALAWTATFLGVMILDVDIGLYIGVGFTLLLVIFRSQRPRISILGNIPFTDIYESVDICEEAVEITQIRILRFEESVFYANVDTFKRMVIKYSAIDLQGVLIRQRKRRAKLDKLKNNKKLTQEEVDKRITHIESEIDKCFKELPVRHIILDCSCVNNIDLQGVGAFSQLIESFQEIGVQIHLTFCKSCVIRAFKKSHFKSKFDYDYIYPTTHDAVLSICDRMNGVSSNSVAQFENIHEQLEEDERLALQHQTSIHSTGDTLSKDKFSAVS